MKTKSVENVSDYKDKEDLIIDQEPAYKEDEETKLYKGDNVVLYIPEVDVYPDMVAEKWTIDKLEEFADKYHLTIDKTYKETEEEEEGTILKQNREPGDPIYNGYTLKVTIAKKPEEKEPVDELLPSEDDNKEKDKDKKPAATE